VSFYPAKILGCFGDGGVVVTNDDEVARKVRLMRDHGRDPDGKVVVWGLNSRLDNLQAAILNHQFQYYGETIARRRQIAQLYDSGLRGVKEVTLPPSPEEEGDHFDTYQNYEIEADRRDELRASLKEVGIGTLVQWGGVAVHQMKELGFHQRLPRTEKLFTRSLMLPMNTYLSDEDVQTITDAIRQFYRR